MPVATGSQATPSRPLPVDAQSSKDQENQPLVEEKSLKLGNILADVFPLIKIMEVQVCCYTSAVRICNTLLHTLYVVFISDK